jgi:hypothetical protein
VAQDGFVQQHRAGRLIRTPQQQPERWIRAQETGGGRCKIERLDVRTAKTFDELALDLGIADIEVQLRQRVGEPLPGPARVGRRSDRRAQGGKRRQRLARVEQRTPELESRLRVCPTVLR